MEIDITHVGLPTRVLHVNNEYSVEFDHAIPIKRWFGRNDGLLNHDSEALARSNVHLRSTDIDMSFPPREKEAILSFKLPYDSLCCTLCLALYVLHKSCVTSVPDVVAHVPRLSI